MINKDKVKEVDVLSTKDLCKDVYRYLKEADSNNMKKYK